MIIGTPDLGICPQLQARNGTKLAYHVYAESVQIYRWDGTSWMFVAPEAELFAMPATTVQSASIIQRESLSGSKVAGRVLDRCTPDRAAIPWLSLGALNSAGPGIFHRVTFIQRVNTVGGVSRRDPPPGDFPGEVVRVDYSAEYFFHRAH